MGGLIVEGTSGTGKSELLRYIVHQAWHPKRLTPLTILREGDILRTFVAEHSPGEMRGRTDGLIHELRDLLVDVIRKFVDCVSSATRQSGEEVSTEISHNHLVDRFHLTAASWYTDGDLTPWHEIDEMLADRGFKLMLLYWPEDHFEEMFDQLLRVRGPQWERFLESLAPDRAGQIEHFLGDQKRLLRAADQSQLEALRIDTGKQDWTRYAEQATEFWGI